jgi:Gpi18-like mannosyltransferase
VFLLFKFISKEQRPFFFIFIMLNPGFLFNNIIWGQVDGIVAFLLMACVLALINRKNTAGLLLYVLALNFKVQSIIYFPLIVFILIHNISDFSGIKRLVFSVSAIAVLQLLIITPFILTGSTSKLMEVILNSVDKYPQVSMNAYNWWFWVFEEHPISILDSGTWLNVTYKTWGLLIFFLSSVAALLPLFLICLANIFNKNEQPIKRTDLVFASGALVTILFFFCNTQMHERYSHYALIFLAGYFAVTNNYLPFLLACIAYFLNMEAVLRILNFPNYDILFFIPEFIAVLYLILIFALYYIIYKRGDILLNIKQIGDSLLLKK